MYASPESTNAIASASTDHKVVSILSPYFSSDLHNLFIAKPLIEKNLEKEVIS